MVCFIFIHFYGIYYEKFYIIVYFICQRKVVAAVATRSVRSTCSIRLSSILDFDKFNFLMSRIEILKEMYGH